MARATNPSPTIQRVYYSDFLSNFDINPVTGNLGRTTNEESVKSSIKRLILTHVGERLYSDVGSNIGRLLFEPLDFVTIDLLKIQISETITNHEPRAALLLVQPRISEDEHELSVSIVFSIINKTEPITLDLLLKRVR